MIKPKRYMIFIPSDGSTYERMDDPRGDWIHDPDHKIDVSKFCEAENEQGNAADAKQPCDHEWQHRPCKPAGFTICSKCGLRR